MQKKKTNKGQKKRQIPPIDNSYPHVHVRSGSRRRKTRRDLIEFLAIQQHLSAPPHLDSAAFNQPHVRAGKHTHTHHNYRGPISDVKPSFSWWQDETTNGCRWLAGVGLPSERCLCRRLCSWDRTQKNHVVVYETETFFFCTAFDLVHRSFWCYIILLSPLLRIRLRGRAFETWTNISYPDSRRRTAHFRSTQ